MGEVGSLSVDAVHPQQRSDGSNSRRWVGPFLTGGDIQPDPDHFCPGFGDGCLAEIVIPGDLVGRFW